MSKNYDNWEKLVGAVLKKEQLRQIALCRDLSSSSSSSSSSSTSSFSSTRTSLFHHQFLVYNGRIPPPINVPSSGTTIHGKCVFLPVEARELTISSINFPERHFLYSSSHCINFSCFEVVEVDSVSSVDIRGKIKTRLLSPRTIYGAYLWFIITSANKKMMGLDSLKAMIRFVNTETDGDAETREQQIHVQTHACNREEEGKRDSSSGSEKDLRGSFNSSSNSVSRTLGLCDSSPADACAPCGLDEASTRMVKMAQILPNSGVSEPAQKVFDKMSEPIPEKKNMQHLSKLHIILFFAKNRVPKNGFLLPDFPEKVEEDMIFQPEDESEIEETFGICLLGYFAGIGFTGSLGIWRIRDFRIEIGEENDVSLHITFRRPTRHWVLTTVQTHACNREEEGKRDSSFGSEKDFRGNFNSSPNTVSRTLGSCDSSPADACAPCGLDEASTRMVKMAQILPNSAVSEPAQKNKVPKNGFQLPDFPNEVEENMIFRPEDESEIEETFGICLLGYFAGIGFTGSLGIWRIRDFRIEIGEENDVSLHITFRRPSRHWVLYSSTFNGHIDVT
ncbi:PREDICTED: uncharacterized protein LOC105964545 [Erythranthe guttata]|uniref:uncharacterized protein LOC105964545 n=1 Tax=Erythranthe guttata TaxID=4155 RepID=UPI00064DF934|nr:PREDICTED: uncharacterized protein LOC105964545 [Erythranthe guttata]|eukprot:XP_012844507.1 PREDICTED: uncharacterized protein LOC105964545 [Erythranthe guttata]